MSHEGGADNSQRTVAELLAKYGAESGERAPRRRRRRDADDDTGAQAIIDRVMSESGEMAPIREDTPPPDRAPRRHRTGYQRPVEQPPTPARRQPPPPAPQPPQMAPPPPQHTEFPRPVGPPSSNRLPAIARSSEPTTPVRDPIREQVREPVREPRRQPPPPRQQPPQPPPAQRAPGQQSSQRLPVPPPPAPPPPPVEPTTEELPRVPVRFPVSDPRGDTRNDTRSRLAPYPEEEYPDSDPDTGYERDNYDRRLNEDLDDEVDERDGRDGRDGRDYDYDRDYLDDEDLDDLDGRDDEDEPRERSVSPAREWLVMAGQLALGVLGGAAVWLGFNWLWGFLPQAALVVALAVIVGLVLIVRKIRRAEDLQTTVLAVLVGLVVTVSPAALLLLNQ